MDKMKKATNSFKVNTLAKGACELCEMRDSSPDRKDHSANLRIYRDINDPERVYIMGGFTSRKVALHNAVTLLRGAATRMEVLMQNRMPEDEIAKRFQDALYGIIKAAHEKPEDAEDVLNCLDCMLRIDEEGLDVK